MTIDESKLTKGQIRKLNALRKSIGEELASEVFPKWLRQQEKEKPDAQIDPVAEAIRKALEPLAKNKKLSFGRHGYAVKRAKGRGKESILVSKIQRD